MYKKIGSSIISILILSVTGVISPVNAGMFDNIGTWTYSVNGQQDDYTNEFLRMITLVSQPAVSGKSAGYSLADINGDGLIDVMYSEVQIGSSSNGNNTYKKTAILFNKGDYSFGIGYKCVEQTNTQTTGTNKATFAAGFYGDCAQ